MDERQEQTKKIQINTMDDMSRGRFSNSMMITHTPEEFIIDWLMTSPTGTHLTSRVIVTPGHIKRIIAALTTNLQKYEQKFGEVKSITPSEQKFH
jgi:hypothetical protein